MPMGGENAATTAAVPAEETRRERGDSLFSFADPGGYVWWAGVVLGALAACCLASIIVIAVKSARAAAPAKVFAFLSNQSCPSLSPLLASPVPFVRWMSTCPACTPGLPCTCYSREDCVLLSSDCAAPSWLSLMSCERESADSGSRKVCKVSLAAGRRGQELPNGGFCTFPGDRCAWCADWWTCSSLATCVAEDRCNTTAHPSTWQCTSDPSPPSL